MIKISICICTRNRQKGLKNLLESLVKMEVPTDANIRIIVVENDSKNLSENIVKEFASRSIFRTNYFLETSQGLAFARNRSVKEAGECDFCCFVDDDQVVDPDWLVELVKCQREFDADGVWGRNPPIFNKIVPSYIRQFHTPKMFDYGTIVKTAYTNCLLLRKKYLDLIVGPFDLKLNFTGGEDYNLIQRIIRKGGTIRFNPNAIAYELVPNSRTNILFVVKRTYRIANAGYFIKSFSEPDFRKIQTLTILLQQFFFGLIILLPYLILTKKSKLKGLIKLVSAIGGIRAISGKINRFYA